MANKKINKSKKLKNYFAIPILITLFLFFGLFFLSSNQPKSTPILSPVPTMILTPFVIPSPATSNPNIQPEELIQNGVYINTKYKIKFTYSINIFSSTTFDNTYTSKNIFERTFYTPTEGLSPQLSIAVITNNDTASINDFNYRQNLEVNVPNPPASSYTNKPKNEWPDNITIKTREVWLNGNMGFVTESYPSGGGLHSEGEAYYDAQWKIGDKIYRLFLITIGQKQLEQYSFIFNKTVDSFQFLP